MVPRDAGARRYRKLLASVPNLILPPAEHAHEKSAWHLYPVRLAPDIAHKRDDIFAHLHKTGIGANAEAFVASEISIPLFPRITPKQQKFIADTLKRILAQI